MQVFEMAPAEWLIGKIVLLCVGVAVIALIILALRPVKLELSAEGLRLSGTVYGRTIPREKLDLDHVRQVDFASSPELRPGVRTFGTGFPGYQAGWFRLKNGEKALVYLTDMKNAILIPTSDGYNVLVSPKESAAFLSALKTVQK